MKYIKFFLIAVFILLTNCSKDNNNPDQDTDTIIEEPEVIEPETEVYFTFNASIYDPQGLFEKWIIIHNENGELLDYRSYEDEDTVVFEGLSENITDKISVTLMTSNKSINTFYGLNTTSGVDKGSTWNQEQLTPYSTPERNKLGETTITLNNFPEIHSRQISNQDGFISGSSRGISINGVWTHNMNVPVYEKNDYIITFIDDNSDYKYYYLDDVQTDDNIQLDFNQFNLFDDPLTISLPDHESYTWVLRGYDDSQNYNESSYVIGFSFDSENPITNPTVFKAGFLDRFTKYSIQFDIEMNGYAYYYSKKGEKPNEIIIPEKPSSTIENATPHNFKFSTNLNHTKHNGYWMFSEGVINTDYNGASWNIISNSNEFYMIGEFPEEIKQTYPQFQSNLDKLEYKYVTLSMNSEESVRVYNE